MVIVNPKDPKDPNIPYPKSNEYWRVVEATMTQVFNVPARTAADCIKKLRFQFNDWPIDQQILFYHSDPLDVAADLAQKRPDPAQINDYRALASKFQWFP